MGLPYKGPVFDYKEDDPERLQPQLQFESHIEQLIMTSEEDRTLFKDVSRKALEGKAQIMMNKQEYDPEQKTWRILLAWYDMYYTAPDLGATNG